MFQWIVNETHFFVIFFSCSLLQQCGQHVKEIDYGGWPAPRNHMSMKQGYEVCVHLIYKMFVHSNGISSLFQAKMNEHHHNNLQKGKANYWFYEIKKKVVALRKNV